MSECALDLHHLECCFVAFPIVQQDGSHDVQYAGFLLLRIWLTSVPLVCFFLETSAYLEQSEDELSSHIVFVVLEQLRIHQAIAAVGQIIF